ncbi:hypothetical protein [Aestuariivirga sp.]|uniref:hypothetical protein n=1 Tax=Aestuariivirga sp. TaxID=2650926 RepID=UPI003BAC4597
MPITDNSLELWITLGLLVASVAIIGFMSWLEHRPRNTLTPRLIPTTPVIIVFAFVALLAAVHLVNLFGIHTGRS